MNTIHHVLIIMISLSFISCASDFENSQTLGTSANVLAGDTSVSQLPSEKSVQPSVCQNACDDGNACTIDTCLETGCQNTPDTGSTCDDKNACTTNEVCSTNGWCMITNITNCDDNNPCTSDACDFVSGCSHEFNQSPCQDNNKCTQDDQCAQGSCSGMIVSCTDNNPCTTDACDSNVGCVFTPTICDDQDPWTYDTCTIKGCHFQPIEVLIGVENVAYKQVAGPLMVQAVLFINGLQNPLVKGDDAWLAYMNPSSHFVDLKQLCTQWTKYVPAEQLQWNAGYKIFENGYFVKNDMMGGDHVFLTVAVTISSTSFIPLSQKLKMEKIPDDPYNSFVSPELGEICKFKMK